MKSMNEKIYIRIVSSGVCATLGYVITPINIVRCELAKVYDILKEGFTVEEVNESAEFVAPITLDMFTEKEEVVIESVPVVEELFVAEEEKKETIAEYETTEDITPVDNGKQHNNKKFKFTK